MSPFIRYRASSFRNNTQRGNNRQATFFAEEDYRSYLDWLLEAAKKYDCRIYAYVLMINHVHLLASAERPYDLSRMMQHLGRRFVRYVIMLMASRTSCSRPTSNTSGLVATRSSGNTPTGNSFEASWTRANLRRFAIP